MKKKTGGRKEDWIPEQVKERKNEWRKKQEEERKTEFLNKWKKERFDFVLLFPLLHFSLSLKFLLPFSVSHFFLSKKFFVRLLNCNRSFQKTMSGDQSIQSLTSQLSRCPVINPSHSLRVVVRRSIHPVSHFAIESWVKWNEMKRNESRKERWKEDNHAWWFLVVLMMMRRLTCCVADDCLTSLWSKRKQWENEEKGRERKVRKW